MLIKIGDFDYTEVWDGVLYKKLSHYPKVSDWEIRTIIEFIEYEEKHGRTCSIECEDKDALRTVLDGIKRKEAYRFVPRPKLLTECTACPYRKGCVTDHVCHTTSADNAIKIFACGKLLSAVNVRQVPVEVLIGKAEMRQTILRTILNTSCSRGEIAKRGIDWSWNGRWGIPPMKRS